MSELFAVRPIPEEPAEHANDGVDRLPAERREAVDQNHIAAEAGGLHGSRNTRDARAHHAQVGLVFANWRRVCAPHDLRPRPEKFVHHEATIAQAVGGMISL